MCDGLKTEFLKYVWLMHQGRDVYIISQLSRHATNLLGDKPVCFFQQIIIYSIGYKTVFMTSVLRSNCCTVLSLGTVGLHTPVKLNHTKFLIKLKTEINDQYPIDYTLPSSSSLPRRGTYIIRFEKFSFNGFGNSASGALESHSKQQQKFGLLYITSRSRIWLFFLLQN